MWSEQIVDILSSRRILIRNVTSVQNALVDDLLLVQHYLVKFILVRSDYSLVVLNNLSHAFVDTLGDQLLKTLHHRVLLLVHSWLFHSALT